MSVSLSLFFSSPRPEQFNFHTFKSEEQTYITEQIQYEKVAYIDNQCVLDLIEARPAGLLALLDEELKMPNSSSKTYVAKLHIKVSRQSQLGVTKSCVSTFK
jgi:myosin heavy subunit